MDGEIIKQLSLSPPDNVFSALYHCANWVSFVGACKEHGIEETSLQSPVPLLRVK